MSPGLKWGCKTNWLDKSELKIFVKFTRKLKVGLQWIYFYCIFIFRDNIVLHPVSCLLWCLPELSNDDKNQAQEVMRLLHHDCFNVLTNIDLIAFIPARRHASVQRSALGARPGVGNLRHACHPWHAKQFLMARRSFMFYISILLWFTKKVYLPWLVSKYVCCWHTEWFETFRSAHSQQKVADPWLRC